MKIIYHIFLPLIFCMSIGFQTLSAQEVSQSELITLPFKFIIGDWEGEGWHDHGSGRMNEFHQTYSFISLANGQVIASATKALLKPDKNRVLFEGTILYTIEDSREERISRKVLRSGIIGPSVSVKFEDNKFFWTQRNGTENWEYELLENGQLVQRGFKTKDDHQFFELILERQ